MLAYRICGIPLSNQTLQAVYIPSSWPPLVKPRACTVWCVHISQHMTWQSHLMKLSGNECSGLMTEGGRRNHPRYKPVHSELCVTVCHADCFHLFSVNYVPTTNKTCSSATRPLNPMLQTVEFCRYLVFF